MLLEALVELLERQGVEGEVGVAEWRVGEHARRRGRVAGAGKGQGKGKENEGQEGDRVAKGCKRTKHSAADGQEETHDTAPAIGTTAIEPDSPTTPNASTSTNPASTSTASTQPVPPANATATATASSTPAQPFPRPSILSHLMVGINDCTRALESRIRWGRWALGDPAAAPPPPPSTALGSSPALRRGHKRRHRSARATDSAPEQDQQVGPDAAPSAPVLPLPAVDPATGLPPFLVPSAGGAGPVLLRPNHNQFKPASPRSPPPDSGSGRVLPAGLPIVDLIFVCRPDINPPALVAHLPTMAAAANGVRQALAEAREGAGEAGDVAAGGMDIDVEASKEGSTRLAEGKAEEALMGAVYLVPLDVGAEHALAATLALRRVAAIGISVSSQRCNLLPLLRNPLTTLGSDRTLSSQSQAPHLARLLSLVREHIAPLQAPWLVPHLTHPARPAPATHTLIPTHIKHLRTTAPADPKAALLAKKQAKVAARDAKRRKGTSKEVYMAED